MAREILDCERVGRSCSFEGGEFDVLPGQAKTGTCRAFELLTIGSLTENSDDGDHNTPARLDDGSAPAWDLWRRIAAKDTSFGRPDVFGAHIPETKWESATVTTLDARIPHFIEKIAKRDPFSGKVVTGGIVTAKDSSWLMSWTVNRQPQECHLVEM